MKISVSSNDKNGVSNLFTHLTIGVNSSFRHQDIFRWRIWRKINLWTLTLLTACCMCRRKMARASPSNGGKSAGCGLRAVQNHPTRWGGIQQCKFQEGHPRQASCHVAASFAAPVPWTEKNLKTEMEGPPVPEDVHPSCSSWVLWHSCIWNAWCRGGPTRFGRIWLRMTNYSSIDRSIWLHMHRLWSLV